MKAVINKIKNLVDKHKSVFAHGGWGIGKTHLIKNEFMKEYENDYDIIYIDSRIVDLKKDVFDHIIECVNYDFPLTSLKEKLKEKLRLLEYRAFISFGLVGVGVSMSKKWNQKDNPKKLDGKLNKKTLIIFDELDRITPESILKILNCFNGLSLVQNETPFKTMMVGNKKELENILSGQFNIEDNENFLEKYFDELIDIDRIRIQAMMEIANSKRFFENIDWQKVPSNARALEKKYIKLENLIEKYGGRGKIRLSLAVFYAFFVCDLFQKNKGPDDWRYIDNGFEAAFFKNEKDTKTIFQERLLWNQSKISDSLEKGDYKEVIKERYKLSKKESESLVQSQIKLYERLTEPLRDIIDFSSLDRFEEWVSKWESKFRVPS